MSVNNKISNIIGTALPKWLMDQLGKRANELGRDTRDNDNILFLSNKTAWVRLVSSININSQSDLSHFQREVGPNIQNPEDLAKQFVLFGGTSKYLRENSYQQRSGIGRDGAYGILGDSEIQQFGYRPMPGITSVSIDTQGTLGSLRMATVSFKCWDKAQLDIIDALYFKLGFTMFLEWGHTFFYPNDGNNVESTEAYSIDPFRQNLTKEQIALQITKSILQSDGNYDAMLGMVTNFNFSYNQEGGYDCTLKITGLGILGDSIKINNPTVLPPILPEEIVELSNTLTQLATEEARRAAAAAAAKNPTAAPLPSPPPPLLFQTLLDTYKKKPANNYQVLYSSNVKKLPGSENAIFNYDNQAGNNIGFVLAIRNINGLLPFRNLQSTKIKLGNVINVTPKLPIFAKDPTNYKLTTPVGQDKFIFQYPYVSALNKNGYGIEIEAEEKAYIDKIYLKDNSIDSVYEKGQTQDPNIQGSADFIRISADTLKEKLWNALGNKDTNYTVEVVNQSTAVDLANNLNFQLLNNPKNETSVGIKIIFTLVYDVDTTVRKKQGEPFDGYGRPNPNPYTVQTAPVRFVQKVSMVFNDPYLIAGIETNAVDQTKDYLKAQDQIQNQSTSQENQSENLQPNITQIKQALQYQSGLELTLRTIQVHALNRALKSTQQSDIKRKVFKLEMTKDPVGRGQFYDQIFTNGVFSSIIKDLINKNVRDNDDLFKLQSKYGFATEFMAGRVSVKEMEENKSAVDFNELLTAYVVPYEVNQELVAGINTNHPVYIPFGLLLMILNNICTIYDTKNGTQQTPLVYVDFNPNLNFFLSNTKHLTTNPFKVLIPYEGSFSDYKTIFPDDILNKNKTKILPLSGSKEEIPLFNKEKEDRLSQQLPKVKFDGLENNVYRGKLMNVLLNIDYLVEVIKDNSTKDGSNSIYLKPFLEQLLLDINKYLGDFSLLRLAYNDGGNTFHIVDDQVAPPLPGDTLLQPDNKTEIPLVGRFGLAKNLEIRSDVSTKLANMLAISANADATNKATLSTNGDSFGFINTGYTDRYIPERRELTGSSDPGKGQFDTLKSAAMQFNQTVADFYSTINPSDANVPQATNYYIERMSKIKNNEFPTKASSMIPVSVNFTMDGIAGLTMGQAFSISDQLLPYTYNNRILQSQQGLTKNHINKVGFAIVGLNNIIENNQWNTSVRANMIFLKYATEFTGSVSQVAGITSEFLVNPTNAYPQYINPVNITIPTGQARANLVAAINKTSGTIGVKMLALAQATLEGYYPNTQAYRNNNPGNLRSVQGPFQQFATLEEGAQALVNYINRAINKQNRNYTNANNLLEYINVYAPSSDNNDPNGYVASVLGYFRKVGVNNFNANTLLSEISNFSGNVNLI